MSCLHCGQPLAEKARGTFCCSGCAAVYAVIHDLGLADYYRFRPDLPSPAVGELEASWVPDEEAAQELLFEGEYYFLLDGLHCAACAWLIERALEGLPGVLGVGVNYASQRLRVRPPSADLTLLRQIMLRVQQLGYKALPYDPTRLERPRRQADRMLLLRFGVAASVAGNVMLAAFALYSGADHDPTFRPIFQKLCLLLTLPVVFFSAVPFWQGARRALSQGQITTDVSIALGLGITFAYSVVATLMGSTHVYFDTVAMFVFVLLLGRLLEGGARTRAGASLERLLSLQSHSARRWNGQEFEEVPSQRLQVGDRVEVAAGQRVPADGKVVSGRSFVDEAHLTGESQPRSLAPEGKILGGSLVLDGCLVVELTQTGGSSLLAQVARLLEEGRSNPGRLEKAVDRLARVLLPLIVLLASLTLALGLSQGWSLVASLDRALAVLIITCPCALGIATPLVSSLAGGVAARHGILFREGQTLEQARNLTHMLVDKTGTLTLGELRLDRVVTAGPALEWLHWAASLEASCHHPLARALETACKVEVGRPLLNVENWHQEAGLGVSGEIHGRQARLGRAEFLGRTDLAQEGQGTAVWLEVEGEVVARFEFADALRPEAADFVKNLAARGIQVCLASGDRPAVVEAVAAQTGIQSFRASCLPADKLAWVEDLQAQGAVVAFLGDGINDAPALQKADVGIAVANGSALSWEVADLVLLRPGLLPALQALQLADLARLHLWLNLLLALFYNLLAIPAAMLGWITPLVAAVAMPLSSLAVVGQSLLLLGYSPDHEKGGLKWTHSISSFLRRCS